ncbi:MAG: ABC transporter substrate-binding protein [Tabrizicola sp.]|nr:ABC transporter substrate-binding protein [Tabrizicola sp.]
MISNTRRTFLIGTAATAATAVLPSYQAFAQTTDVLRFITSDLSSLDPIVTTGTPIRNYGYMVFETLFAMDEAFKIQPQMAKGHEVSEDGLTWTVILRDGLMWHDDTPVTAADCVASVKRWGSKDSLGQSLMAVTETLEAVDDKTFRFTLTEPFPLLVDALGKPSTPICFMMPERLAQNDASTPITEVIGSGPFRFMQDEWVTGSKSVYEKFQGYVPRDEPPSGLAGGKVVNVQRVEWLSIADYSTATAAIQRGEADWYDKPDVNLITILEDDPEVTVGNYESGAANFIRFNHQQAPFNNIKVRQAVMAAVNQEEYLTAMVGLGNYEVCKSFFYCGTPMSTGAGNEAMLADFDTAKKMLDESGYDGEKVAILGPTDILNRPGFTGGWFVR